MRIRSVTSVAIPSGGEQTHIFDSGGGQKFAEELQAPLLGQVPIDPRVCAGGDAGEPLTRAEPNSTVGMFTQIKTPLNATFSPSV
ncbi:hypothetical protein NIES4071_67730 [Calothrix sp. NIES-4071]|nr:hypothetical protein NIES4071_67730 [Calothrix sp. NIES-4071]BAZ61051.1 hypothetical protein NIES4105_67690 [Calothrix sp. NIES-4105]